MNEEYTITAQFEYHLHSKIIHRVDSWGVSPLLYNHWLFYLLLIVPQCYNAQCLSFSHVH